MCASVYLARLPACGESTCRRACRGRLAVPLTLPGTRKQAWQATRASCPMRGLYVAARPPPLLPQGLRRHAAHAGPPEGGCTTITWSTLRGLRRRWV